MSRSGDPAKRSLVKNRARALALMLLAACGPPVVALPDAAIDEDAGVFETDAGESP